MTYPEVLDEQATLALVCQGRSLARFGDGEFNLAYGKDIPCQHVSRRLRTTLLEILHHSGECLVGIPNLRSSTPKAAFWSKYEGASELLADRPYVSSFVSRPDSAPWINTPEYWSLLESLWIGQDVTLVRGMGSEKSLQPSDLVGARSVREVLCTRKHAFFEYDAIVDLIGTPKRVLLCLGPTATVLAVDLCGRGVHAVDLGHVALFLRKARRGEPMVRTASDKAMA